MESFLNRYRNITILLLAILAQLVLLSLQVKNDQDVRFIRLWTVTAVSPIAKLVDALRGGGIGFVRDYIHLHDSDAANRRLQKEVDDQKLKIVFLQNQLETADRAKALQLFQAKIPSKTLPASVIMMGLGTNSMVFVDRGSLSGVMRGMGVLTPDGILGKVTAAYPTSSQVLLVTDPEFAAGVVSIKNHARGTLKGYDGQLCKVDYVPFEDKVEPGDWFYTSGDDRMFPSGFPVGVVKSVQPGQPFKEIMLEPSGMARGLEDVLIVLDAVHQDIPDTPPGSQPVYVAPPPPTTGDTEVAAPAAQGATAGTEADRLKAAYKAAGDAQNHTFGEDAPHSKPPDFTKLPGTGPAAKGAAPLPPAPAATKDTAPEQKRPGGGR
jgi:rod shape-determining protein MreC